MVIVTIVLLLLLLEYPMKAGLIENWSDVEDIWEYMLYNELGIEEGNHPILITEVANTPRKNREKIAEVKLAPVITQLLPCNKKWLRRLCYS